MKTSLAVIGLDWTVIHLGHKQIATCLKKVTPSSALAETSCRSLNSKLRLKYRLQMVSFVPLEGEWFERGGVGWQSSDTSHLKKTSSILFYIKFLFLRILLNIFVSSIARHCWFVPSEASEQSDERTSRCSSAPLSAAGMVLLSVTWGCVGQAIP